MERKRFDVGRVAALLFCGGMLALLGYLALRYLLPVAMPFLLAWGLAILLRPLNARLARRLHLPYRPVCALTVLFSLFAVCGLLFFLGTRLIQEMREAILALSGGDLLARISGMLSGEGGLFSGADAVLGQLLGRLVDALLEALPPLVGSVVLSLPSVLLFLFVSVIAAFYFAIDLSGVHAAVRACLPRGVADRLGEWRQGAMHYGASYLRSYLILTGVIFLTVLAGLTLLGVRYALLLSALLAAVDILPVIGVGTVLLPWGVISIAMGDTRLGVGLLLLFGAVEILRQVLEPRLLGTALGVHPLLSLFSLYLGTALFGVLGLLLAPAFAVAMKLIFLRISAKKTKNPSGDGVSVGQARSTLPERRQREQT